MHTIAYDSEAGIVRMSVAGFWTTQSVQALFADFIPLLAKVKATGRPVLVLSDARNFPVQSSDVGEAFARADLEAARLRDRMAVVVGSTLNKLQARRFSGAKIDYFTSFEEAERWLWSRDDVVELPSQSQT